MNSKPQTEAAAGTWIGDVFKPLPKDEADALQAAIGTDGKRTETAIWLWSKPMSAAREQPSNWRILKVLELAAQHLNTLAAERDPDADPDENEAEALLDSLHASGADVAGLMEQLLLAADQAKNEAELIKAHRDKMLRRQQRRDRKKEACRAAALAIMGEFPELFRPSSKSKALAAFRSPLVDARIQRAQDDIIITDEKKLMEQERFVTKSLNRGAVKVAVIEDGEVLDGVERKNGGSFLVVKTS